MSDTPKTDALISKNGAVFGPSYFHEFSEHARQLERDLEQVRAELRDALKRDGDWLDKWGCCRICDGEIPYGHTEDCYLYKQEQRAQSAESLLSSAQDTIQVLTQRAEAAEAKLKEEK